MTKARRKQPEREVEGASNPERPMAGIITPSLRAYDTQTSESTWSTAGFSMGWGDLTLDDGGEFTVSAGAGTGHSFLVFHYMPKGLHGAEKEGEPKSIQILVDITDVANAVLAFAREVVKEPWAEREYVKDWQAAHPEKQRPATGRKAPETAHPETAIPPSVPLQVAEPIEAEAEGAEAPPRRPVTAEVRKILYGDTERPELGPTADEYAHGDMQIPANALLGITWKTEDGEEITTVARFHRRTKKRLVRMKVRSWTEIGSFGAMHWYGSLRVDVDCRVEPGGHTRGGYLGKNAPEKHARDIQMRATRKIRAGEKDALGRRIGRRGEDTERLDSKQQARDLCVELFKRRFGPGWVLVDKDDNDGDTVVAET